MRTPAVMAILLATLGMAACAIQQFSRPVENFETGEIDRRLLGLWVLTLPPEEPSESGEVAAPPPKTYVTPEPLSELLSCRENSYPLVVYIAEAPDGLKAFFTACAAGEMDFQYQVGRIRSFTIKRHTYAVFQTLTRQGDPADTPLYVVFRYAFDKNGKAQVWWPRTMQDEDEAKATGLPAASLETETIDLTLAELEKKLAGLQLKPPFWMPLNPPDADKQRGPEWQLQGILTHVPMVELAR